MYLETVLEDIHSAKTLYAEDLYKLSEAVFNLPEEDVVDAKMAAKIFATLKRIEEAYSRGKIDKTDANFFHDYIAVLGTMQNQHFFSNSQNRTFLEWVQKALGPEKQQQAVAQASAKPDPKLERRVRQLEEENQRLKAELDEIETAVATLQKVKLPKAGVYGMEASKGKGKGGGKTPSADESKAKGKGGGKTSSADESKAKDKGGGKASSAPAKGGRKGNRGRG